MINLLIEHGADPLLEADDGIFISYFFIELVFKLPKSVQRKLLKYSNQQLIFTILKFIMIMMPQLKSKLKLTMKKNIINCRH